jgi:hypothetical protein
MAEKRNVYTCLMGKSEGKTSPQRVDERIMLKIIFGALWTGFISLSLLERRLRPFRFHELLKHSSVAEGLMAPGERLNSVELVSAVLENYYRGRLPAF